MDLHILTVNFVKIKLKLIFLKFYNLKRGAHINSLPKTSLLKKNHESYTSSNCKVLLFRKGDWENDVCYCNATILLLLQKKYQKHSFF